MAAHRHARAVPGRDCPGYAGQSRNFRNSAGVKPACRRTGASVPRFTTACWGATATRPSWFRYTAWLPLVRTHEKPADSRARVTFGTGRPESAGAHPAPGSRKVVTDGVAVMCPAGSSTSSKAQLDGLGEVRQRLVYRVPLAGNVNLQALRDVPVLFAAQRCGKESVTSLPRSEGSRTPSTSAGQRKERQPGSPARGVTSGRTVTKVPALCA